MFKLTLDSNSTMGYRNNINSIIIITIDFRTIQERNYSTRVKISNYFYHLNKLCMSDIL